MSRFHVRADWRGPRVVNATGNAVDQAMTRAAMELLRQANHIVPHDTGALMRSGAWSYDPRTKRLAVSYGNTDVTYAVTVHEHPEWRFRQGRQGKWLERTWNDHGPRVAQWVADQLKRVLM